jgi:hypothetical protein
LNGELCELTGGELCETGGFCGEELRDGGELFLL